MQRIVCYGDSNTYGYDAADVFGGPLPSEDRWPTILSALLDCETINCGMNGRTVPHYPRQIDADLRLIKRNSECDLLIVMLGTNDLLLGFHADDTAECMKSFLRSVQQTIPTMDILLVAPPPSALIPEGCEADFLYLAELYSDAARELGIHFADAGLWPVSMACDGVHFSPEGHRRFAECMADCVRTILNEKGADK
ncbi:MAG: hypothetical protein IJH52_04565 [Oscillospiraceae bacterium]|nr:hypothetical protein [Oscillospiraceae bacterium]MBQ6404298.1 hypothetical protein [Oscillospiraceae bacterium]